ncbi:MAG: hypothetical protein JRM75_03915 [Nitrososphaerota archaeon]|nr:hypothetical protein [Nitrososphaerota archaeon]
MTKARGPKKSPSGVAASEQTELVFVVDVSSFTKNGFMGATEYQGGRVELEFDDEGEGLFLTSEMATRLQVGEGSRVSLALEEGLNQAVELTVAGVGGRPRISDPRVYYGVGREGGAVLRLRKT